jgi:hypothetical protein
VPGLTLQHLGQARDLWLFDTFQGLPRPSNADPDFEIAGLYTGTCIAAQSRMCASPWVGWALLKTSTSFLAYFRTRSGCPGFVYRGLAC